MITRAEKNEPRLWEKLANFLFNPDDPNLRNALTYDFKVC